MIKTGCWKNQRAFVVGGGSSLEGFNFEDLRGENLIVVNARLFDIPWAPVFFSMDYRFYKWLHNGSLDKWQPGYNFKKLWDDFGGERLYMQTEPGKPNKTFGDDVRIVKCLGPDGLSFDLEKGLCSGGNSGLAGLYLAVALGANPIYLLGIDMYTTETKSHSYKCKYPTSQINQKMDNYIKRFNIAAPLLEKRGIKVINVNDSRRSGLQCFPFGELQLSGDCGFVVVSYYTKNTEYQNDAIRLIESLDRHGVAHEIQGFNLPLNTRFDWKMATLKKAEFLLEMLDKYKGRNIVWLDADAEVEKYPSLFDDLTCDVGVYYNIRKNGTPELMSGTIFFKNNGKSRAVLEKWVKLNKVYNTMNKSDQVNLQQVIKDSGDGLDVQCLPEGYTHVFDRKGDGQPVITHYQASRRYRNI